jgi:8-oxo-dGTP diphosphatase
MDEVFLPAGIYPGSMPEKPFYLATSALIRDGSGKVLLLKRAADDPINPEKWDLPGGTLDPGETFDRALRREAREETGMRITLRHVAGAGELDLPTKRIAYLIMICDADGTEVDLSPEHEDYAWVDPGEAMAMDLSEQFRGLFLRREDILR